jgi:putative acetyltransferase
VSTGEPRIERFRPEDQDAVKAVIISGLGEHWGFVDPALNPDLDDIGAAYADAVVLVAWSGDEIVGSGVLIPRADGDREVVRMSVAGKHRRRGIATKILAALVAKAQHLGASRVVLETTASWHEARAFYTAFGFQLSHYDESEFGTEAHFALDLPPGADSGVSSPPGAGVD